MEISGFLSEKIEKFKKALRENNKSIFLLYEDLNQYAHFTMWKLKISNEYLPEILSACSYVRAMSLFQSIFILTSYGLINEAKILLRSFVETMFLMVAIEKKREYSSKIVEQEILERKKTCKAIRRNIIAGIHKLDRPTLKEIEEKINKLKDEIAEKNIKKINIRDLSKAAGLESYYDTIYHLLSSTVHINPGDLEQYLELTDERKIKEIKWGPIEDELEDILFASIEAMVSVLESISNMFEIELDGKWKSIHKAYKQFGEKTIEERTPKNTPPENQGGALVSANIESQEHTMSVLSLRRLVTYLSVFLCAILIIGGIYLALAEKFATIKFSFFGNDFSSTSVGVAIAFIGAVLFFLICRLVLKPIGHSISSGGGGGNAEVIGDGEARGGKGGKSGSFGPGGNGGNAHVVGTGKAEGGAGGNGG